MILPPNTRAKYLDEGAYRLCFTLEADGAPLPYVLKVDNCQVRPTVNSPRTYRPWGPNSAGCDREALLYGRLQAEAPNLVHFFAPILSSGPGWLIQERVPKLGYDEPLVIKTVGAEVTRALGVELWDLAARNFGTRADGSLCIFDYACFD